MAAITTPMLNKIPQLRPLNILRDLPAVANVVEKCFADTLDDSGRRYIQQMREAGHDSTFLRWANLAAESASMPLSGYIWEENSEVVGNVSLIPYRHKRKRYYLIANVAVLPEYRRRGIGRLLTMAAMDHARQRHAGEIWLHVRDDNPGAIGLYRSLGFVELARRTQWQGKPDRNACADGLGVNISARSGSDWLQQEPWLQRLYPDLLTWYQPMPWRSLRPGLGPALYRFMMDDEVRHWVARGDGTPTAVVSWRAVAGQEDRMWVAAPPEGSERAITALLLHARRILAWRQTITLDFPAGEYRAPLEAAGFRPRRTLLWMKLQPPNPVHP
jgi:ribosomal protein S18 acetylase RimI-like enzyme